MNRNLKLIVAIFIGIVVLMLTGDIVIIGDKIGRLTHAYIEYAFYCIFLIIGYIYIIRPLIKMHHAPEFPTLTPNENWDCHQLYKFAETLKNNCNYITDKDVRKKHKEFLSKHIKHHSAESDNLKVIISNEVNRRLEGDTNLGVVGIDSRIKEWGKTVFMITAISQNGVFDTVSVLIMNYKMITDIVLASGFRPTKPQMFIIYVRVLSTALLTYCTSQIFSNLDDLKPFDFNNVNEIVSTGDTDLGDLDSSDVGFGNSIIQRIKTVKIPGLLVESAAQGCINALLTMRIGYVTKAYLLEGPYAMKGIQNKREIKRHAIKSAFKAMPSVVLAGGAAIGGTVATALEKILSKEEDKN